MSRTVESVSRWAVVTTFVLSIIGLGFSIYLTITHFQPHALVCADTGTINCAKVTTSAQSYFLGIPVAVLGLFNFVVMVALNSPWAWRAKKYWLHVARFAFTVAGMGFVLWLIYAEIMIGSLVNFHQHKIWGKPLLPQLICTKRDKEQTLDIQKLFHKDQAHDYSSFPGTVPGNGISCLHVSNHYSFSIAYSVSRPQRDLSSPGLRAPPVM